MIDLQDAAGRLIVVLPVRIRYAGRTVCVFVDGERVADFPSTGQAVRYARSLAQGGYTEEWVPTPNAEGA